MTEVQIALVKYDVNAFNPRFDRIDFEETRQLIFVCHKKENVPLAVQLG